MISNFKVSNFRIFGKDGAEFEFKPITFFTGTNSSGKSSLVKAMMLVRSFIENLRSKYHATGIFELSEEKLLTAASSLGLGGYKSCINKSADNDIMSFSFEVSSDLAPYSLILKYSFNSITRDSIAVEGEFNSVTLSLANDETILHMERADDGIKLSSLKVDGLLLYIFISFIKSLTSYYGKTDREDWKSCMRGTYLTYFKNPEIQDRYPNLFKTNFTNALEKTDETNLLFYFPILESYRGLSKNECLEKAVQEFRCDDPLLEHSYYYEHFDELKQMVLDSFAASEFSSLFDYYLNLENKILHDIVRTPQFNIVGYQTRRNLIKDEICDSISYSCSTQGLHNFSNKEFNNIYTLLTLSSWDDENAPQFIDKNTSYDYASGCPEFSSTHILWKAFIDFVSLFFEEILLPPLFKNTRYVNDSFTSVQKMYTYNNTSSFCQIIKEYSDLRYRLDGIDRFVVDDDFIKSIVKFKSGEFLNKWLKELCGIEALHIMSERDGLGYILSVTHKDGKSNALADEGHGITQLVHILLQIECQILRRKSRILDVKNPLIINLYSLETDGPVLVIEEPEVSLHPSLQSHLANLFYDAYKNYRISFVIETHSEYLIRKTQAIVSNFDLTGDDFESNPFKLYYFNSDGSSYEVRYNESGRFEDPFGSGFFDEAGNSSIAILKREKKGKK